MRNRQKGVGLGGLMVGLFVLIVVALLGMRLFPAYMEFFTAKKIIQTIVQERGGGVSVAEVRKAFDARASIDNVSKVSGADLEITKEGGEVVISFAYRSEVPLFKNLGVYIDFAANSKPD